MDKNKKVEPKVKAAEVQEPFEAKKSPEEEKRWADQNPLTPTPADPNAPKPYMPKELKPGEEPTEEPLEARKSPQEQERWKDQNPWTNQDPKADEVKATTPVYPKRRVEAKPGLLAVRATESFSDGNLDQFFAQYGYSGLWATNDVRYIPAWLLERCRNSGGEFELADG